MENFFLGYYNEICYDSCFKDGEDTYPNPKNNICKICENG